VAQALAVTAAAAALIAVEADLAASALEATLAQLGLSPVFEGLLLVGVYLLFALACYFASPV
jgi:Ca2+/H+ antiporter